MNPGAGEQPAARQLRLWGLGISFKPLGLGREGRERAGEMCGCCWQNLGWAEPDALLGVPRAARGARRGGGGHARRCSQHG